MRITFSDIRYWLETHGASPRMLNSWKELDGADHQAIREWADQLIGPWAEVADLAYEFAEQLEAEYERERMREFLQFGR